MTIAHALRLAALLCVLLAPGVAAAPAAVPVGAAAERDPVPADVRPRPRPEGGDDAPRRRCTGDGLTCIAAETYARDVCGTIEAAAGAVGLDAGFLARLLWRESLFDAGAVSPVGAQGIAQFMPGTARLRGLADPFNPAEAIVASAAYLKDLEGRFGNLGLAAAAYNAGEARAARYLAGAGGLPGETRAYVLAITGHRAAAWRAALDGGPAPAPDLRLDPERPFEEACLARAQGRGGIPAFRPALRPWGAIVAGQASREAAERRARALGAGPGAPLAGERIDYTHERLPGMRAPRHFAQVGRDSRSEADALCARLRAAGTGCIVRRN